MAAVGTGLVIAAALRPTGVCVRTQLGTDFCAASRPLGTDSLGDDALLPLGIGVAGFGLAVASGPLWRDGGELETSNWLVVAGLAAAVLAAGSAYALVAQ